MKRKLFILGTLGLAGLFAGGVVAAYTITDNADKQGIKITPGTITDDEVGSVTLSWGDMTSFTKVEGLSAGTPITRTVNIKALTKDADNHDVNDAVYLGKLDVELRDLSGKAASAERLIDYLHVNINGYAYNTGTKEFADEKSELGVIPTEGENAFSVSLGVYANASGKAVDFVISLDAKATPVMSQIMTDQVYLTVDWNRGDDADTGLKHVYIPSNGWNSMYVYAYSASGQNADWPGVQLEKDSKTGLFEGYISEHDYYIFNDGASNQYPASGQDGMTKAAINYATANAIYFDWSTHAFTSTAPVVSASYYLVGETTGWAHEAAYGLELDEENLLEGVSHQYSLTTNVEAGKEYKLNSGDGATWLGFGEVESESQGLLNNVNGNFTFKAAGSYTFYVKEMSAGGHQVYIAQNA